MLTILRTWSHTLTSRLSQSDHPSKGPRVSSDGARLSYLLPNQLQQIVYDKLYQTLALVAEPDGPRRRQGISGTSLRWNRKIAELKKGTVRFIEPMLALA
jgi:hypothetical protein